MTESGKATFQVTCPCCKSALTIDPGAVVVTECVEVKDPRRTADLKDAEKVLREEKARVDARYQEIVRADKEKGATMDKKFKEFLEKSQDEPPTKPLRDVDLD
jgi:bifunctional ADP-heptose synthase (sugar kinase/adenylyltransferase)